MLEGGGVDSKVLLSPEGLPLSSQNLEAHRQRQTTPWPLYRFPFSLAGLLLFPVRAAQLSPQRVAGRGGS